MMMAAKESSGFEVNDEYTKKVQKYIQESKILPRETMRMEPIKNGEFSGVGNLRERTDDIDLVAKLKLQNGPVTASLLGNLASRNVVQVTIEVDDLSLDDKESYTGYLPAGLIQDRQYRRHGLVGFQVKAVSLGPLGYIWKVLALDPLA